MKERQIESGVAFGRGGKGSDQTNHTFEKTTKRKELAKIAGTSEGSIKQKKLPHGVASFLCLCRRSDPPGTTADSEK